MNIFTETIFSTLKYSLSFRRHNGINWNSNHSLVALLTFSRGIS